MSRRENFATIRVQKDYMRLVNDPVPYVKVHPLPSNMLEWHFAVLGPENTPYKGGVYHGKLIFPLLFPFKNPNIYLITPNGRCETNTPLCLSQGLSYNQPDYWEPSWTAAKIFKDLLSFMVGNYPTFGSIETSDLEERLLASRSMEFNLNDTIFCDLFPDLVEEPISQNQRFQQDAHEEIQSVEQEFTEDVVKKHQPTKSPKIHCAPECEKKQPHLVTPKYMKEPSPKPNVPYMYAKEILLALVVIVIAVTAVLFGSTFCLKIQEMFPKTGSPPEPSVATIIENLKREFSEQPPMTFKIVNSALRRVTKPDPKAPAIIVLLAELGAEEVAGRFALKVAQSISASESIILISGHTYQSQDHDDAKKDIDILISENLREDQLSAVLVDRLDYIPAEAAMIFHAYCDGKFSPFKRVVYLMTIASKKTQLKLYEPKDWDMMVQDHLYKSWRTCDNDQVTSLLSHLTVSVAAIVSGG